MKKKYDAPSMEIEKFTVDYIMTYSSGGGGIEEGGDEIGGNSNTNSLADF